MQPRGNSFRTARNPNTGDTRIARRSKTRTPVFVTAVAVLLAAGVGIASAGEEPGRVLTVTSPGAVDVDRLGDAAVEALVEKGLTSQEAKERLAREPELKRAGRELLADESGKVHAAWLNADGELMASVTDREGEKLAREAGAIPRYATRSTDELDTARAALEKDLRNNRPDGLTGAEIYVDPTTDQVVANYFFADGDNQVPAVAGRYGDAVRATVSTGAEQITRHATVVGGAKATRDGATECTVGFAVTIDDQAGGISDGVLTAGHCFNTGTDALLSTFVFDAADGGGFGVGFDFQFANKQFGDYGVIELGDGDQSAARVGSRPVLRAEAPFVGQTVCKQGIATGETCGTITALDVSVTDSAGIETTGMTTASYTSAGGDSGGPVYGFESGLIGDQELTAVGVNSAGMGTDQAAFTPVQQIADGQEGIFLKIQGG